MKIMAVKKIVPFPSTSLHSSKADIINLVWVHAHLGVVW
jgi:hypothetical protein